MMGKRIIGHILNRLISLIPSIILLGGISLLLFLDHFILRKDESGWLILYFYRYMIFLPTVFFDLIRAPLEFLKVIEIILPALISLVIIETISIKMIKCDIGMKIMGLKILSLKNEQLGLIQIIIRTIIKYFSLAFFPFVFLYIAFNKEKMTLHDKISSTKVLL